MTAQDKRDRRKARHEAQAQARIFTSHRIGLFATNGQIKAASKKLADQFFSRLTDQLNEPRADQ